MNTRILELDTCEDCPYKRKTIQKDKFGDWIARCGRHELQKRIPDNGLNIPRWCPLPTEKQYLKGKRD